MTRRPHDAARCGKHHGTKGIVTVGDHAQRDFSSKAPQTEVRLIQLDRMKAACVAQTLHTGPLLR
jgi:hypothetical protein